MPQEIAETNPLELSDEDFLKMAGPPDLVVEDPPGGETASGTETAAAGAETVAGSEGADTVAAGGGTDTVAGSAEGNDTVAAPSGQDTVAAGAGQDTVAGSETATGSGGGDTVAGSEAADKVAGETPPDYEGFFKKVMTPFKANGKTIELKTPEEAVQLMQMGANYTRKMQDMVPHRKALTMLQSANLLDEDKLSFLIDLDKKNPEAIKKLIKDSGIDPLEIDMSTEPAYTEGSHRVTDSEVNFRSALDDLGSTPDGQKTIQDINTRWDQASKDVLWEKPETLAIIHAQREYGIYDRIVAEIDRQQTLGQIPAGTPFLQAYKIVGDELTAAKAFEDLREKHPDNATADKGSPPGQEDKGPKAEPVATRVAAPKSAVANDAAASAAAATRAAPTKAQVFVNPLAMSDDEFLKSFNGRL